MLPILALANSALQWLPNQLQSVLDLMVHIYESFEADGGLGKECDDIMDIVQAQKKTLKKEVDKYCSERSVLPDA